MSAFRWSVRSIIRISAKVWIENAGRNVKIDATLFDLFLKSGMF